MRVVRQFAFVARSLEPSGQGFDYAALMCRHLLTRAFITFCCGRQCGQ